MDQPGVQDVVYPLRIAGLVSALDFPKVSLGHNELEHDSLVDEKVHPQGIELFGKAFNLGSAAGRLKGLALPDHPAIVVDGLECRGRSGGEATATHAAGHLESQPKRHIICDKKGRYWRGYRS